MSAGFPGRSCVSELVEDLKRVSGDFRTWWDEYRVLNAEAQFRRLRHPRHGTVPMRLVILADGMHPSIEVVYHLPQLSGH